jgi:serine/threonine protein kinase
MPICLCAGAVCMVAGTLDYMAPEVLRCPLKRHPGDNKDRPELHYATAVDAWAVGVLAYELLTGR